MWQQLSRLPFTDIDSLKYEIKTKDVYKDFSNDKEMFDFTDCLAKSKYYCLCDRGVYRGFQMGSGQKISNSCHRVWR